MVRDCGERLQRRAFCCCNNPIKGQFQESLEGGFFCSYYTSVAVQFTQKQSISTSKHLVWNTCLMIIQLNTWMWAFAKRSNHYHLSWNVSEDILLLLTLHTSVLGSPLQWETGPTQRLCFRKCDPLVVCLKLSFCSFKTKAIPPFKWQVLEWVNNRVAEIERQ